MILVIRAGKFYISRISFVLLSVKWGIKFDLNSKQLVAAIMRERFIHNWMSSSISKCIDIEQLGSEHESEKKKSRFMSPAIIRIYYATHSCHDAVNWIISEVIFYFFFFSPFYMYQHHIFREPTSHRYECNEKRARDERHSLELEKRVARQKI